MGLKALPEWVLRRFLRFLLERYAGEIFETGIDVQNLKVELSKGSAMLSNLSLNLRFLNALLTVTNLRVTSATVGSISIRILPPEIQLSDCSVCLEETTSETTDGNQARSNSSTSLQIEEQNIGRTCSDRESGKTAYKYNLDENIESFSGTLQLFLLQQLGLCCKRIEVKIHTKGDIKAYTRVEELCICSPIQFQSGVDVHKSIKFCGLDVQVIANRDEASSWTCGGLGTPLDGKIEIHWVSGISFHLKAYIDTIQIFTELEKGFVALSSIYHALISKPFPTEDSTDAVRICNASLMGSSQFLQDACTQDRILDALVSNDGENILADFEAEVDEVFEDAVSDLAASWTSAASCQDRTKEDTFEAFFSFKCSTFSWRIASVQNIGLIVELDKIKAVQRKVSGIGSTTLLIGRGEIFELWTTIPTNNLKNSTVFQDTLWRLQTEVELNENPCTRRSLLRCQAEGFHTFGAAVHLSHELGELSIALSKLTIAIVLESLISLVEMIGSLANSLESRCRKSESEVSQDSNIRLYIPKMDVCATIFEDEAISSIVASFESKRNTAAAINRILSKPENAVLWAFELSSLSPTLEIARTAINLTFENICCDLLIKSSKCRSLSTDLRYPLILIDSLKLSSTSDLNSPSSSANTSTRLYLDSFVIKFCPSHLAFLRKAITFFDRKINKTHAKTTMEIGEVAIIAIILQFSIEIMDDSPKQVLLLNSTNFLIEAYNRNHLAFWVEHDMAIKFKSISIQIGSFMLETSLKCPNDDESIRIQLDWSKEGIKQIDIQGQNLIAFGDLEKAKQNVDLFVDCFMENQEDTSNHIQIRAKVNFVNLLVLQIQKYHGTSVAITIESITGDYSASMKCQADRVCCYLGNDIDSIVNDIEIEDVKLWLKKKMFSLIVSEKRINYAEGKEIGRCLISEDMNIFLDKTSLLKIQSMLPPETRSPIGVFDFIEEETEDWNELIENAMSKNFGLASTAHGQYTNPPNSTITPNMEQSPNSASSNGLWFGDGITNMKWDFVPETCICNQLQSRNLKIKFRKISLSLEESLQCHNTIYCFMKATLTNLEYIDESKDRQIISLARCDIEDNLSSRSSMSDPSYWLIWPDPLFYRKDAAKVQVQIRDNENIKLSIALAPIYIKLNNDRISFLSEFFNSTNNAGPWEMLESDSDVNDKRYLIHLHVDGALLRLKYELPRIHKTIKASFWLSEQKGIVAGELPDLINTLTKNWCKEIVSYQRDRIRFPGGDYYKDTLQGLLVARNRASNWSFFELLSRVVNENFP